MGKRKKIKKNIQITRRKKRKKKADDDEQQSKPTKRY